MSVVDDFVAVFYDQDMSRDNFHVQVFRLIAKADPFNLRRLARAFPNEVAIYLAWMNEPVRPPRDDIHLFIAKSLMEWVESSGARRTSNAH